MEFARHLEHGVEVRCDYNLDFQRFDLYFINRHWQSRDLDGFAQEILFSPKPPQDQIQPAIRLTEKEAQYMMDRLWNAGMRPTGVGSAGELGAVQNHLRDMRAMAFKGLEIELPK